MTQDEIDGFRAGYWEHRTMVIGDLQRILTDKPNMEAALAEYLRKLEADEDKDYWQTIQEENPGITREEHERQLTESFKAIREKYYRPDGLLKARLVRGPFRPSAE